ncbi:type II toxin-antitoxin system RelE/ParE family toxin [Nesterenkonia ebinurensis]|uniref:type II toxin-antitoxin system RelE/ParE family toxin n=1 Tax=Nesterenkonia ebinurensis TaxID=2608252 RepID=UPI00123D38F9
MCWSLRAENHIFDHWCYVADVGGISAADAWEAKFRTFCDKLTYSAGSYRQREDLGPGYRTVTFRKQVKVIYRVRGSRVEVLGVYSTRQDWEAKLRD